MANPRGRLTRSKLTLDLAAVNDALTSLEIDGTSGINDGGPRNRQRGQRYTMDSLASYETGTADVSYTYNETENFSTGIGSDLEEEKEEEVDVETDELAKKHGSELVVFRVDTMGQEMKIHKSLLAVKVHFRPIHGLSPITINAPTIIVNVFIKVRGWLYRGENRALSIIHDIGTHGTHRSRDGIRLLINCYVLANRLDCVWLQDLLIDFILSGYYEMKTRPDVSEIGLVFTNTIDGSGLRDYMTLVMQYILLATGPKEQPTNHDVSGLLLKFPELHADFIQHSRGIMHDEQGIWKLPKLEEHMACTFHVHADDSNCRTRDMAIKQLLWDPQLKKVKSNAPAPGSAIPIETINAAQRQEPFLSRATRRERVAARAASRASFVPRPLSLASYYLDSRRSASGASTSPSVCLWPTSQRSTANPNPVSVPIPKRSASSASTAFYTHMAAAAAAREREAVSSGPTTTRDASRPSSYTNSGEGQK